MKATTTIVGPRFLVIVIIAGIFIALFPLFIIGVEAQPPIPMREGTPDEIAYDPVNKRMYVTNFLGYCFYN